ncbi:aldehyde reductase [Lecanosticta acicola]|uniref:Aldehyde reductase n=1 Tax=Lecanosticta acicola TaxID=111012 RepID=A0AAI9E830_9PEZI|nr:aldehyde reductase [Lecanosticta acicola]
MANINETVLITGGSGFIASHCILLALQKGYQVRTTVRDLTRTDHVKKALETGGATQEQIASIKFFAVDLGSDDNWSEACRDCTYMLHVASPFPPSVPKHEDELIVPAKEGTLRALRFGKEAGSVKRVVVTSSYAAIGYGHASQSKPYTEDDWSVIDGSKGVKVPPYQKSKTIAEKAAWDWIAKEGGSMDLAVVNPVGVFGPVLSGDFAASVQVVSRLLNGEIPACPNLAIGAVDVRDVADLHLRAMTDPKAAGQRYLACADSGPGISMKEIAHVLKKNLPGKESRRVTTRTAPNFLVKLMGLFDPAIGLIVPELGVVVKASNEKAKTQLGWSPRSQEDAIVASGKSLIECGVVKK